MDGPANVDIVYETNYDDLDDGFDTIHAWYNCCERDDIHPNWLGERMMRENLLVAIGYLSPTADWTDSITMLAYTDWNDVAEQTNPTYETITDPLGNLNFVGGELDVPPKDGIFQNFAITDMGGGDMWLESIFLEDACCNESDEIGGGTAGYWEFAFTESDDQYQDVWFDYTIEFENGFTIAAGTKTAGVINTTHNSPQRMMLIDDGTPGEFQWQWYSDVFSDDNDSDPERSASTGYGIDGITLSAGNTYRITQRYYSTSSGDNGFHYLFIDNLLVAKRTGMRFNSSTTTTSHWDAGDMSWFMGGDQSYYAADHDESHFTNNFSWFIINDNVTTITEGQTLDLGYDISDILEAVDTFHDN